MAITTRYLLLSTMVLRFALAFQTARRGAPFLYPSLSFSPTFERGHLSFLASKSHSNNGESLSDNELVALATSFVDNKNAAGSGAAPLDGVFDMCSTSVNLYGLQGDAVRPGFVSFFQSHEGLHHELLERPRVVGAGTVQYPFIKRWRSISEEHPAGRDVVWKSIDSVKPRNKVERLCFDAEGKLEKVAVVEADAPLE